MDKLPAAKASSAFAMDESSRILRDCRGRYLKEIGQLLQEAEPPLAPLVSGFRETVGAYFDEMVSTQRRSGFELSDGLTASRISLVGEDDLELEIRLGEFSSRLMESTGGDLWRVYLRFVTLLDRPDLSTADNPVGPKGIALGLTTLCAKLGQTHDQALERIERLENYFSQHLSILYANLNDYLAEQKVAAAHPSIVTATDKGNAPASGGTGNAEAVANPAAALQKQLLGPTGELAAHAAGPAASLLSQAMLERLLARLDELEKSGRLAAPGFAGSAIDRPLETLIPGLFATPEEGQAPKPQALNSTELGVPTGAPEAATIDALARIFEAIFESPTLPDAIKGALSSLQIPTLKAAMLDPGFFTTESHPARLLLDRMAHAAIGLPLDVSSRHPLCVAIQSVASHVRAEYTSDIQVFEHYNAELDSLTGSRDKEVMRAAEAYLPLLYQADRRKQADRRCRQVIESYAARGIPESIQAFLYDHWLKVLLASWEEGGEQSAAWQENVELISNLLWSIQPKTEVDDRKRLAKMLPSMLQRLNAGMARVGVPDEVQAAFLDCCFELQTAAMRGAALQLPAPSPAEPSTAPATARPTCRELTSGQLRLKVNDLADDSAAITGLHAPPARPGAWLAFRDGDREEEQYALLCQVSPASGMLLLVNPDWDHALALHPALFESMLAAGSARICSTESLFNSAAEQALRRTVTS